MLASETAATSMMARRAIRRPIGLYLLPLTLAQLVTIVVLLSSPVTVRSGAAVFPVDSNQRIGNIRAAIAQISPRAHEVDCQQGGFVIPAGGHFQGIQQARIGSRQFAIISGSSDSDSYLVLADIEESRAQFVSLKNLLGPPFKHAGGFQVIGDYLAVGIEDNSKKDASQIWIIESAKLLEPEKLKPIVEIKRSGSYKRTTAGAVGIAKLHGQHLLLVATWDSATIDIYASNGKALDDPAIEFHLRETWDAAEADTSDWLDDQYAAYQNINLILDKRNRVFMIGFAKTGAGDIADIFELRLQESVPPLRRFKKISRHIFHCQKTDFRTGAGLAVNDSKELLILSCGHREFAIEYFKPDVMN